MKSNKKIKYQKPEIHKLIIDTEINLIMMSGGTENNAPHGPFGQQKKIEDIGKKDPFRA